MGWTHVTEHIIDTGDAAPIKVPPRPIPFHYQDKVHRHLQEMAKEGIIRPSSSPWSAPAVYVPKDNGEIRICVDFVQLNKVTKKDSYPVPRADGPQQKMSNKKVFSKIDLKSAYWQFPIQEQSIEKTAFSPGPGYGLWEFTMMPYGLTGATQMCQRGLDAILKDCKDCVDNYVDNCIVFSDDMASHITDLNRVLSRIEGAGLVGSDGDWEEHLQMLLFLYRTTKHATTGLSPHEVLFGSNPPSLQIPTLPSVVIPNPSEYSSSLKKKILELRELVEANIVKSAEHQ